MYKVELKIDMHNLIQDDADQICKEIDHFFETEKLICVKRHQGTRIYISQGCREDYGRFWAAIFAMKHSKKISENLKECFWYNGDKVRAVKSAQLISPGERRKLCKPW